MKLSIYALHDITAECYSLPMFIHNDNLAKRAVLSMANTPGTTISENPEDFRLYRIGEFDDSDASFSPCKPEYICRASDLVMTKAYPKPDFLKSDSEV